MTDNPLAHLNAEALRQTLAEMRAWLTQLRASMEEIEPGAQTLPDADTIRRMSSIQVCVAIDAEYDGGVSQFVADQFAQ